MMEMPPEVKPTRRSRIPGCIGVPLLLSCVLAIAIPNLIEARKWSGESPAIGALRTITTAQALFREGDKDKDGTLDYASSLAELESAHLIDGVLASGRKQKYIFRILSGDRLTWSATALPDATIGEKGRPRFFFVDESGVIRFSTTGLPTVRDPAIGG